MQAYKTKYIDILLNYEKETIEDMVFLKEEPSKIIPCDVGIVFGGISMIPYRLKEAERLYKEGLIEKILVTGGIGRLNIDRVTPEAIKMAEFLMEQHIPKNDILLEPKAKNSYENIKYSLEIIKENENLINSKLMLITSEFHMKRCILMMEKELQNMAFYSRAVKDGKTDLENWKKTLLGKRVIYQEALLLSYYAKHNRMTDFSFEIARRKRIG